MALHLCLLVLVLLALAQWALFQGLNWRVRRWTWWWEVIKRPYHVTYKHSNSLRLKIYLPYLITSIT